MQTIYNISQFSLRNGLTPCEPECAWAKLFE